MTVGASTNPWPDTLVVVGVLPGPVRRHFDTEYRAATNPANGATGWLDANRTWLGRHGWIALDLEPGCSAERWTEVVEWIRTSYLLVTPKKLARQLLDAENV